MRLSITISSKSSFIDTRHIFNAVCTCKTVLKLIILLIVIVLDHGTRELLRYDNIALHVTTVHMNMPHGLLT